MLVSSQQARVQRHPGQPLFPALNIVRRYAALQLSYRRRYGDSLLRRMGCYPPGLYYGGEPVIEGTYLGGSFFGTVGVRPYVELPTRPSYYRPTSPGIIIEGGDATFTFGTNWGGGGGGGGGWRWGLDFSGSRGDTSWSGQLGGGGR